MPETLTFHPFDERFLTHSACWLQDDELCRLIDAGEFSATRQREWFNSLAARHDYHIWGVALDDTPVGAVGLKNIANGAAEYFGYLGDKSCWGRGLGHQMLAFAELQAHILKLTLLRLRVLDSNPRALRLYQKYGYRFCLRPDDHNRILVKVLG